MAVKRNFKQKYLFILQVISELAYGTNLFNAFK